MKMMRFFMAFASVMPLLLVLVGCGGGGGGGDVDGGGDTVSTAPQVLATNPAHQSTGVETNRTITAKFSKDMKAATINENTFFVTNNGNGLAVVGFIDYDADSRTAILGSSLSSGTSYTVTLTNAITDMADNSLAANYVWTFSTGTVADTTAPTVRYTNPASSAIDVPINTSLSVTFSENIDPTTITPQTVSLRQDGGSVVSGNLQIVGATVTFRPVTALAANTMYTATITTGVEDLAGNPLAANNVWGFTTTSGVDVDPPQILSVSPGNGAQNVPLDASIIINYSEPIMPFEFGLIEGRPVYPTFNSTYTTATLTPTVPLSPNTTYAVSIQSRDAAGNEMLEPMTWRFTTGP